MRVAFLDPLEARLKEFPAHYLPEHELLTTEEAGRLPEGGESAAAVVWWSYPLDSRLLERLPNLRFLPAHRLFPGQG